MARNRNYDVIIAGGGPAGSSAAIHLALRGARDLRCNAVVPSPLGEG